MTYRERYVDLIRRYLGRNPERADGVTDASITECERRLGVRLPTAVRDYYLAAGRLHQLNRSHNLLFSPDEWCRVCFSTPGPRHVVRAVC